MRRKEKYTKMGYDVQKLSKKDENGKQRPKKVAKCTKKMPKSQKWDQISKKGPKMTKNRKTL